MTPDLEHENRTIIDLFDLMLDDTRHRQSVARLREIARAREVVVDFLARSNEYASTGPSLQKYFDQFALAARRARRLSGVQPVQG